MTEVAVLTARLTADTSDYQRKLQQATGEAETFAQRAQNMGKQAMQTGAMLSVGLGLPIVAVGKKALDAASDLNESMSKSNTVFANNAKAIEKWATVAADSIGMSKQQALEAVSTYGAMLKSMGLTEDAAAGMSKKMVTLAADLGSFHNKSVDETTRALRGALSGEYESLKSMGIVMNEAGIQAEAMAMGISDGVGPMDAATKAQAAMSLVTRLAGDANGDYARTQDGAANSTKKAKAKFDDAAAALGTALLPVLLEVLKVITPLLEKFSEMSPTMKTVIVSIGALAVVAGPLTTAFGAVSLVVGKTINGVKFVGEHSVKAAKGMGTLASKMSETASGGASRLRDTMSSLGGKIKSVASSLADGVKAVASWAKQAVIATAKTVAHTASIVAQKAAAMAVSIATKVATAAQWLWNAALSANPIGLIIAGIALLVGAIIYAWNNFDWFREGVIGIWEGIQTAFSWAWESVIKPVFDGIVWFVTEMLIPAFKLYWDYCMIVWNAISAVIQWVWESVIKPIWDGIKWYVENILIPQFIMLKDTAMTIWNAIGTAISWVWETIIKPLWDAIQWYINTILIPLFLWLKDMALLVWGAIGAAIAFAWNNIIQPAWEALKTGIGWIIDAFFKVKDKVGEVWDWITDKIEKGVEKIKEIFSGAKKIFGDVWDQVKDVFKAPIKWVVDNVINKFIGGVNSLAEKVNFPWRLKELSVGEAHEGGIIGEIQKQRSLSKAMAGDEQLTMMRKGEGVIPVDIMRKMGRSQFEQLRRGSMPGDAYFGDPAGGPFESAMGAVSKVAGDIAGAARELITKGIRPGVEAALGAMDRTIGEFGPVGQIPAKGARKVAEGLLDFLAGAEEGTNKAGGIGILSEWAGREMSYPKLIEYLKGTGVNFRPSSTLRPGSITSSGNLSHHSRGRAVDFVGNNLMAIFDAFKPVEGILAELIYSGAGYNIKNGRRVANYAVADHWDHVHAALRDGGIVTRPTRAMVGEGGPEAVIPLEDYNGRFGSGATFIQNFYGTNVTPEDVGAAVLWSMRTGQ